MLLVLGWLLVSSAAAQPAGLDAPGDGERIHVVTPGEVRLEGPAAERRCTAPCLLHLPAGRYHVVHETLGLSGDVTLDRWPLVVAAQPLNALELGLGIAAVAIGLAAGGVALGLDASRESACIRGGTCEGWFFGLLVPAAVVLVIGVVLVLDAGGEITAQAVPTLPPAILAPASTR